MITQSFDDQQYEQRAVDARVSQVGSDRSAATNASGVLPFHTVGWFDSWLHGLAIFYLCTSHACFACC